MLRYTIALLAASAFSGTALAEPVNINTADVATLAQGIVGVSDARATMIVEYRERHGPFQTIDDIVMVPGIGTKILEANRANLTVGELTAEVTKPGEAAPSGKSAKIEGGTKARP